MPLTIVIKLSILDVCGVLVTPLTPLFNVLKNILKRSQYVETSQLICSANRLTGFYVARPSQNIFRYWKVARKYLESDFFNQIETGEEGLTRYTSINQSHATGLFLYPLKTSENL